MELLFQNIIAGNICQIKLDYYYTKSPPLCSTLSSHFCLAHFCLALTVYLPIKDILK